MTSPSHESLRRCLEALNRLVGQDAKLLEELAEARKDLRWSHASAEPRFREWFLFERKSRLYGEPPAWTFQVKLSEMVGGKDRGLAERITENVFGVFEVLEKLPGKVLSVRDLFSQRIYSLREPHTAERADEGNALVGRLFATGAGDFFLSPDSGFLLQDAVLLEALRADFAQARLEQSGTRISQAEVENLFWKSSAQEDPIPLEEIEHRWERLVRDDLPDLQFRSVRSRLQNSQDSVQEISQILEELAFHTTIELDEARKLLLYFQAHLREKRPAPEAAEPQPHSWRELGLRADRNATCPCGSGKPYRECCLPSDAVAAFEKGKQEGKDLELLFSILEESMEIESEPEEDDSPLPHEPEMALLAQEFLWEQEEASKAKKESPLTEQDRAWMTDFARFAQDEADPKVFLLEELGPQHFAQYFATVFPFRRESKDRQASLKALEILERFCRWADEEQGAQLLDKFAPLRKGIEADLVRLVHANHAIANGAKGRSSALKLLSLSGETAKIENSSKTQTETEVVVDPKVAKHLVPGDWLIGSVGAAKRLQIQKVFPHWAEPFLKQNSQILPDR